MPVKLINLDRGKRVLSPGDKGFLISLAKTRWNKHAGSEAVKLLKSFAQQYYEAKCPEVKEEATEEVEEESEAVDAAGDNEDKTQTSTETANTSGIQFIQRELVYNNCGFIASNLEDPSDYAHYVLTKLGESKEDKRTKFPFRIMPVQEVCEARPRAVEKAAIPLMEKTLGLNDQPYRFSLMHRGNNEADHLTQQEAKAIVRNCVWSVNPNCVQCIKYQDYGVMIDILSPLFCIGIAKDFQRLAGYNTWSIRQGPDVTDMGEDSEDEISDDPTLDEEEEKRRKLRIKRKRRAEKAGLGQHDGAAKRTTEGEDEDEHGEGQDDEGEGDYAGDEDDEEEMNGKGGDEVEENGV